LLPINPAAPVTKNFIGPQQEFQNNSIYSRAGCLHAGPERSTPRTGATAAPRIVFDSHCSAVTLSFAKQYWSALAAMAHRLRPQCLLIAGFWGNHKPKYSNRGCGYNFQERKVEPLPPGCRLGMMPPR
jgi:hypothetical protein